MRDERAIFASVLVRDPIRAGQERHRLIRGIVVALTLETSAALVIFGVIWMLIKWVAP